MMYEILFNIYIRKPLLGHSFEVNFTRCNYQTQLCLRESISSESSKDREEQTTRRVASRTSVIVFMLRPQFQRWKTWM